VHYSPGVCVWSLGGVSSLFLLGHRCVENTGVEKAGATTGGKTVRKKSRAYKIPTT